MEQLAPQHSPFEQHCTGAPCSHQRTWAENDFLRLLSAGSTAMVGLPPDFLSTFLASRNFMRLSLMKAAHLALVGAPRAFSLLLCTGKRREVWLFLRKSHVGSGCSVCTRSENALIGSSKSDSAICTHRKHSAKKARYCGFGAFHGIPIV